MEAFAMRSCGTNESTSNEPHAIAGSQHNVVRHSSQYGLAMNHQVSISDGDYRCDRHFPAPKNCPQETESNISELKTTITTYKQTEQTTTKNKIHLTQTLSKQTESSKKAG